MNIKFYRKNVYGVENTYVADKFQATAITMLTGKKTINEIDMSNLKFLGHTFTEVIAPRV